MKFAVEKDLLQDILNYLVEKPYKETSVLIALIQTETKQIDESTLQYITQEESKTEEK